MARHRTDFPALFNDPHSENASSDALEAARPKHTDEYDDVVDMFHVLKTLPAESHEYARQREGSSTDACSWPITLRGTTTGVARTSRT